MGFTGNSYSEGSGGRNLSTEGSRKKMIREERNTGYEVPTEGRGTSVGEDFMGSRVLGEAQASVRAAR